MKIRRILPMRKVETIPMKKACLVVLLGCLGSWQSFGQQASSAAAESRVMALERLAKLQAYASKDLRTLDALLDEEFVDIDQEGKARNRAEFLAYVQMIYSLRYTMESPIVRLHGDTAIVTGLYQMSGVLRGKPFLRRGRFVDTWLMRNEHWVEIAGLSTPGK
jgi:hypothetical protein